MWIYYYCSYGPGHQSQDDGFKYFDDDYDTWGIEDYLLWFLL